MAHCSTVLSQIVRIFPRHEFQSLANKHHVGQKFRSFSRWTQFVAMLTAQLTGRSSLRDVVDNLSVQGSKLYHLGVKVFSRATLARCNESQPHTLYEELFQRLLARCQSMAPRNKSFKLDGKIYLLDASLLDLTLSLFPWAKYQKNKGAAKLHVGLDADGYLPAFVDLTEGKEHEINHARELELPKGSYVVFDRGYTDYTWYQELCEDGVFFVTRLKSNAIVTPGKKRRGRKSPGVIEDREIHLGKLPETFRLVTYRDEETGIIYQFVTNALEIPAQTVADLYKERWQIELFFKWIKQNLKVKSFLGTSMNAVKTQLWIALCAYLVLSFLKFQSKVGASLQRMLRILQLNLFEKRDLEELFKPSPRKNTIRNNQLALL
ncbi:IS4 family transposase [Desulfuromonas versatilis]|uniref:IS4 family transposase n=1 Tax=Desulfuromonas versatilis TaxID=2802975 RepID=A0ABM8HVG5_9BACT|nr:IS4 family transposase [Desulfuromonas versatilis]BCR04531.1 IS4 family transposase [Desulfuromonas versatilis]BCR05284.1 IS4 family transposase [Desulfuromonas versatilis]BCR05841.1 IS4 family transposase [Desulfuromonas versatilis]BCR06705.1 IS4 family transposase [Desulfuromonas versatilis]